MSVTSRRAIDVTFEGDQEASWTSDASPNEDSPGAIQIVTLSSGNNTITVPGGGATVAGVTIIKPTDNSTAITFKGVAGDTGVRLHDTDPDSISLHSGVASFVLNAGAEIVGVRLVWT